MALIHCKECNKQVSDKAAACPNCGAPIAFATETQHAGAPLTTIQATSKKFKLHTVAATVLIVIGALLAFNNTPGRLSADYSGPFITGLLLTGLGLAWYITTRIRTWWHHS